MTQADKGRFCGACQKQVVDFTSMSDAQLVAFFKKESSGSVCGRFMSEQLDKSIDIPKKRIPWVRYFFQFTLPLFLTTMKSNAQAKKGKVAITKTEIKSTPQCKKPDTQMVTMGMIARIPEPTLSFKEIMGSVTGIDNKPVPYANIFVKGTIKGVQADSSGFFRINLPAKQDSVILTVSSVGYENKELVLTEEDKNTGLIVVELTEVRVLNGAVVVTGYNTIKGNFRVGGVWSKVTVTKEKEKVKPDFALATTTVYPNPLPSGESVNIKCDNVKEDDYVFQLMTTGGQQVFQKEIWIDKDAAVLNIQLPKTAPGIYFIVMTGRQHMKRFTDKIVIE
jgi:hypothetical protein